MAEREDGVDNIINISVMSQRSSVVSALRRSVSAYRIGAAVSRYNCRRELLGFDILAAFDARQGSRHMLSQNGVAVISSDNARIRRMLAGCDMPCVTCGTSPFDTVTISSLSHSRAMMTVQRSLPTFNGGFLEPCELPLSFFGCDIHSALITAAVLLICLGSVPSEGMTVGSGSPPALSASGHCDIRHRYR